MTSALEQLVNLTNQTCLVALDKCSENAQTARNYWLASLKTGDVARRMKNAVREVGLTLPVEQRATRPFNPWLEIAAMNPWCVLCR